MREKNYLSVTDTKEVNFHPFRKQNAPDIDKRYRTKFEKSNAHHILLFVKKKLISKFEVILGEGAFEKLWFKLEELIGETIPFDFSLVLERRVENLVNYVSKVPLKKAS